MEKEFAERHFIINSLLGNGLSILAGSPKVGKSWLVLDWCVRVANGENIWNLHTQKGTVLYISLEDDENRLQNRLLSITDEVPENIHFATSCSTLEEYFEEQIKNFVSEHKDTVLIAVDTLQLIRSGKAEQNYASDYSEIQKLKKIADELQISFLAVHHLRKQSDNDPVNEISGTNGIAGCADAVLILKKSRRTQGNAVLYCTGRDIEDREIELSFSKEECTWKMMSDSAENPNMLLPDELNKLIEMMKDKGFFEGSNDFFIQTYNICTNQNLSARVMKRLMNKWKYKLNENGVFFESFRKNNVRSLIIRYVSQSDDSDIKYDKIHDL